MTEAETTMADPAGGPQAAERAARVLHEADDLHGWRGTSLCVALQHLLRTPGEIAPDALSAVVQALADNVDGLRDAMDEARALLTARRA